MPPIRESFRTLPDTEFERLPKVVRFLLQKAKAFQMNLAELTQGVNPAPRQIARDLRFRDSVTPERMAARVREYLGITVEMQSELHDDDSALKAWRSALQGVGIFVFKDAFRTDDFFGFSLYDDIFPLIYVNNSATKTRQTFTLFHELGHILFHTSGIDTPEDHFIPALSERNRRIEVLCNSFAAHFLVPEDAFARAVAGLRHDVAAAPAACGFFPCQPRDDLSQIPRPALDHAGGVSPRGRCVECSAARGRRRRRQSLLQQNRLSRPRIYRVGLSGNIIRTRSMTSSLPTIWTPSQRMLARSKNTSRLVVNELCL